MSIVRTALRFAARKAIEGNTMAGDFVKDSSIVTLEDALMNKPAPIVLIYTEDSKTKPDGKEMWGNGTVEVTFLIAVTGAFKVQVKNDDGEPEEVTVYEYPTTDTTSELSIDVIERQIKGCLTDPDNRWGQIFLRLFTSIEAWESVRGSSVEKGRRFAARQIVCRVQAINDPVPGSPPVGVWADLIAGMREDADEGIRKTGDLLQALMASRTLPASVRGAMQIGLTRSQMRGIAINPVTLGVDGPENDPTSYIVDTEEEEAP